MPMSQTESNFLSGFQCGQSNRIRGETARRPGRIVGPAARAGYRAGYTETCGMNIPHYKQFYEEWLQDTANPIPEDL
ncbi:hypothetical protein ES703_74018 [subsurface metagenome]